MFDPPSRELMQFEDAEDLYAMMAEDAATCRAMGYYLPQQSETAIDRNGTDFPESEIEYGSGMVRVRYWADMLAFNGGPFRDDEGAWIGKRLTVATTHRNKLLRICWSF